MSINMETQITKLLQKHHGMSIDEFFSQPMDIRAHLFTSIFLDFLGKDNFDTENLRRSIDQLNTYVSGDKNREEQMNQFMETMDRLRHAHIQNHPDVAIANITKKALTHYIDITFGIDDPETLFYNTKSNHHLIEHLFEIFTGHRFNKELNGLITYIAGYPDAKICYPNRSIDTLESLDELMIMLQEVIKQTAMQLELNGEALIAQVQRL